MAGQRQMNPVPFRIAPGIYTEDTGAGSTNRWKDGDMVRFASDQPEKLGGNVRTTLTFDTDTYAEIIGHVRAVLDWTTLDGTRLVAIGTECKLYLIQNYVVFDITPIRRQANTTNPFQTFNGQTRVRVTDASFAAELYDHVRFRDATAVGGLTITGEYTITAIIDENTYEIEAATAASSSATGGGAVVIQYDISCGLADDGTILTGYGTGLYGMEDYGNSMDETSTYTGSARVWSLDKFGEDLLASPRGESLYWWDRSNGTNSRAVRVQQAPENISRFIMSPNEKYALAFGSNEILSGNEDKMLLRWCDTDNFFNWTPPLIASDESFAGFKRPNVGSYFVTALRTDSIIAAWSDIAFYAVEFVGEPNIFEVTQKGEQVRIMGPNCAVEVNGVIFFMARDDFYVYDGTLRPMECDIWTYVFRDINRDQASKFYAWVNTSHSEIWFHYAREGSLENDRVAIYNYRQKVWYYNSVAREAGHDSGAFGYPYAFYLGELYLHENGRNDGDTVSPMWSFIESYDAMIAEGESNVLINDFRPDMKSIEESVDLYVRAKENPASLSYTEAGPLEIAPYTELVHPRIRGRSVAVIYQSENLESFWRAGAPYVRFGPYGKR